MLHGCDGEKHILQRVLKWIHLVGCVDVACLSVCLSLCCSFAAPSHSILTSPSPPDLAVLSGCDATRNRTTMQAFPLSARQRLHAAAPFLPFPSPIHISSPSWRWLHRHVGGMRRKHAPSRARPRWTSAKPLGG